MVPKNIPTWHQKSHVRITNKFEETLSVTSISVLSMLPDNQNRICFSPFPDILVQEN